jgi:NitT/TauT family transport system ATP-binding protein
LLRILGGLLKPDRGHVQYESAPHRLAMVFQQSMQNLLPWRTVLDNVMLPALVANDSHPGLQDYRSRAMAALDAFGLAWAAAKLPSQLSGGEQQLVSIARWVASPATILLIDEGLSMLDLVQRQRTVAWLRSLANREGTGAILVSHNTDDLAQACDRVLLLSARPARVLKVFRFVPAMDAKERAGILWTEVRAALER